MEILFAKKELLATAYRSLFLEHLSNAVKLRDSIASRYSKKDIDETLLRRFFTFNHKELFDWVSSSNDQRFRHFFGSRNHPDKRDEQVTCLDRFILDAVHFEVCHSLLNRFQTEYAAHREIIETEWKDEFPEDDIPFSYRIQKEVEATKHIIFNELNFPKDSRVRLFSLNNSSVIINDQVFAKWLPKKNESHLVRNLLIGGGILLLLAIIPIPFLVFMGTTSLVVSSTAMLLKTILVATVSIGMAAIISAFAIQIFNTCTKKTDTPASTHYRYNHHSLYADLYNSSKENLVNTPEISPFHDTRWTLTKPLSSTQAAHALESTEEVNCVLK